MKTTYRIMLLFLIGIVTVSCSSVETQVFEQGSKKTDVLTKASAPSSVCGEPSEFVVTEADIRSFVQREKNPKRILSIDPVERDGDALLYVVNYEDGWAIFSADKHLPPVLAKGQTEAFNLETVDNPGVLLWMDNMMDATRRVREETPAESANENTALWNGYSKKQKTEGDNPSRTEYLWTKVLVSSVHEDIDTLYWGPYLQTNWGQESPWNSKLAYNNGNNHFKTGCVAVALSQLLYYFHNTLGVPSGLYHGVSVAGWTLYLYQNYYTSTLSRTDFTDPSPRWAQMPLDSCSDAEGAYVADLMADVGNRVNMHYTVNNGSLSTINDAQAGLYYYGLTGSIQSFSSSQAYSEIAVNNRPFFMQGYGSSPVGHAWVVDGLEQYRVKTTNTYIWYIGYLPGLEPEGEPATQEEAIAAALEAGYDSPEDSMLTYEYLYSDPYYRYHMNWGWNGHQNGYYTPSQPVYLNNGIYCSFSNNQQMLYNIHIDEN